MKPERDAASKTNLSTATAASKKEKKERLAKALRQNLLRRKASADKS